MHPIIKTLSFSCPIGFTLTDIYDRSTNTRPIAFTTTGYSVHPGDGGVNEFILLPSTSLVRMSVTICWESGVRRRVTEDEWEMIVYPKTRLVIKGINTARQVFTRPLVDFMFLMYKGFSLYDLIACVELLEKDDVSLIAKTSFSVTDYHVRKPEFDEFLTADKIKDCEVLKLAGKR